MEETPETYSDRAKLFNTTITNSSETGPHNETATTTLGGCAVDTRYVRSIEGILKLVSLPLAVIGNIIAAVGLFSGVGGWYFFIGGGYIFYVVVAVVIETFISNIFIHRLVDAVVAGVYAGLWGLSAVLSIAFSIKPPNTALGISSIFGFACCGLCIAQVVFAIKTWNLNGHKYGPSKPVIQECKV